MIALEVVKAQVVEAQTPVLKVVSSNPARSHAFFLFLLSSEATVMVCGNEVRPKLFFAYYKIYLFLNTALSRPLFGDFYFPSFDSLV